MNLVTPDFGLIFWQTVTLLTVLGVLKKFAWDTILSSIKDRERTIEESLKSAEKAREEMNKLQLKNEALLVEANIERDKILKDASSVKKTIIEEAKLEANKISDKIISEAKLSINREKEMAIVQLKNESAEISINIAEKLLRKELKSDNDQKVLIGKLLENLSK